MPCIIVEVGAICKCHNISPAQHFQKDKKELKNLK
jgi:hypothetical protein